MGLYDVHLGAAPEALLAADRRGQLDPPGGLLLERPLEAAACDTSWFEAVDRLVDRDGHLSDGIHMGSFRGGMRGSAGHDGAEEEPDVGRTLRQAAHEVAVAVLAVRHVDPDPLTGGDQSPLLAGADAVEHLVP